MPTLGEELKRKREERNVSLTDISEATRIGTRFLKAIETDNYSVLPGGIFTRSFIRAYAKQVGMNEDEAIGLYQQQVAGAAAEAVTQRLDQRPATIVETPPPAIEPRVRRSEPMTYSRSGPSLNWTTVVIFVGIVVFLIVIGVVIVRRLSGSPSETTTPPRAAAPANPNPAAPAPVHAPSEPQTAPGHAAATPPAAAGEPLVLRFEATIDNCSLQYWIDDAQHPTSLLIKKGESQTLPPAQNQVRVNIGNRPAVRMSINSHEAKFPEGTPNWGAKVAISRDNLQTFLQ